MATKLYLPSTGVALVDPAWSVSWYNATSASAAKLKAVTTRIASSMVTKSMTDTDVTDRHFAFGMWVTEKLIAQAIAAQTLTCSIKCRETSTSNNMKLHWIVRLLHDDGTFGSSIIAFRDQTVEVSITANSRFDTLTTNAVTALNGDRIIIEMGLGGDPGSGASHDSSMIIGDDSATDLNAASNDTGIRNPWVNFANTLTFMDRRTFVTHQ